MGLRQPGRETNHKDEMENHKMQSKMFTLILTVLTLLGLSFIVLAQGKAQNNGNAARGEQSQSAKRSIPRPNVINLSCQAEKKEFGQHIYVTNTTGQLIKKNAVVKYAVGTLQGQFTLANDLAANATLKQASVSYEGSPACKAWMFQ
jgi:hypothetical protein